MPYEVEQKYPIEDLALLEQRLTGLGASAAPPAVQIDTYFAHPVRDFATTDEALRIRQVGEENFVTYKGPKIDATTKTRREIELRLSPGQPTADQLAALLAALGFTQVAEVRKTRRPFVVAWQGREVAAVLDAVDGLGTFAELELVVDDTDLSAAKESIASLARQLELGPSERRSYLELLLEK